MSEITLTESHFKVGEQVSRSWKFDIGTVTEIAITKLQSGEEVYIYTVQFPTCTGHFLEQDLTKIIIA